MPSDTTPFAALATDAATIDAFVADRNARTARAFMDDAHAADADRVAGLLERDDRLPGLTRRGAWIYTFRQSAEAPRGLWLRRPAGEAISATEGWKVVFDLDVFCAADEGDWHWRGAETAPFDASRVLLKLSHGGSDQTRLLEFDCNAGAPIAGGFDLGPARGDAVWLDADTLLWSSAEAGDAADTSWPGAVRRLTRAGGTAKAVEIFRARPGDLRAYGYVVETPSGAPLVCTARMPAIGQEEVTLHLPDGPAVLPCPTDTFVVHDATHYAYVVKQQGGTPGALMLGRIGTEAPAREVWRPGPRQAIAGGPLVLRDWLVWTDHDNLAPRLWALSLTDPAAAPVQITPPRQAEIIGIGSFDAEPGLALGTAAAPLVLRVQGPLEPPATFLWDLDAGPEGVEFVPLWQEPALFDAPDHVVTLEEAISDDGTAVPYHLVRSREAGPGPVMLYGYGGFSVSVTPYYNPVLGALWLERGGAYALAHIRGGAEFGPDWHLAAKGPGRRRAFEDFAAVARDLAQKGLAAPHQIGCHGGSNGGLLTGVMLNRYPDRFGAVWSSVGVYDMLGFHRFPAGRAWIDEYGDPDDPEAADWLRAHSPLHTVPGDGIALPPALLTTSANDDRVDPSHARRYTAALEAAGHAPWFFEAGGGHGGGGSSRARAEEAALGYGFLAKTLGLTRGAS